MQNHTCGNPNSNLPRVNVQAHLEKKLECLVLIRDINSQQSSFFLRWLTGSLAQTHS